MYKFKLAIRYILKRPASWLAIAAVALCVFMVVVVMTVLSGLVTEFRNKNHSFTGDCIVHTKSLVGFPLYEQFIALLEKDTSVAATSPVITNWALMSLTRSDQNMAVEIMGIDPNRHCNVTSWGNSLFYHKGNCRDAFKPLRDPNRPGLVIGIERVSRRDMFGAYPHDPVPPDYELAVSCFPLTAKGTLAKMGTDLVNTKVFYFSDDSHTGLAGPDTGNIYASLDDVQMLCSMNAPQKRVSAIYIRFKNSVNINDATANVRKLWNNFTAQNSAQSELLKNVLVQSWKDYSREEIAPLEKEQVMITVLFCMVGIITIFIIFVIFSMLVGSKTKDIGILKSFGASDIDIAYVFLTVSTLIGALGSAIGASAGIFFLRNINRIEHYTMERFGLALWDRSMYSIEAIPNQLNALVLSIIIASAILACVAGALLPAMRASNKRPVEILQVTQI